MFDDDATDKKDVDNCVGIMQCRYYAPKNKVGATPYKLEDLKDYYDPASKPSHYDWDLNCNLENTVRNEKGGMKMSDLGDTKDGCYEIPPCIYNAEIPDMADPLGSRSVCRFFGNDGNVVECIGYVHCSKYKANDQCIADTAYDVVSRPFHYTEGRKYEPKDVIRDWNLNFNLGNTVKYVARAGRKDDILQDLKKARQYLDFEIEYLEKEREEK